MFVNLLKKLGTVYLHHIGYIIHHLVVWYFGGL